MRGILFIALLPGLNCLAGSVAAAETAELTPRVVLESEFHSPETVESNLARLDEFYQAEVGAGVKEVLGAIAPGRYFENWHGIWISFDAAAAGGATVRLWRPMEPSSLEVAKRWMLELAGRMGAETALVFHQGPAVVMAAGEVYASRRDVSQVLEKVAPALRPVPAWRQKAGFASADPPALVELDRPGSSGLSRLTVTTAKPADARRILDALSRNTQTRVCAVINETQVLEEEIHRAAEALERDHHMRTDGIVLNLGTGFKGYEDTARANPAMQKRLAAARDSYLVRYRLDRVYRKARLRWTRLENYARPGGTFDRETKLADSELPPAAPGDTGKPPSVRFHFPALVPGAYRLRLVEVTAPGTEVNIDERTFWFDGKLFQEM